MSVWDLGLCVVPAQTLCNGELNDEMFGGLIAGYLTYPIAFACFLPSMIGSDMSLLQIWLGRLYVNM